ncbi:hypothetical protein HQ403_01225 [Candidatus Kaiserbacteria bacterium]|nr:hypothetical protein [Candidatus Kaiserbacteria bacterium]
MNQYIKKIIRILSYSVTLGLVVAAGFLVSNKKDNDGYIIKRTSAETPYSQSSYYSQAYYQGAYPPPQGDGDDDGDDGYH